jgi:head-tail adaptor
MSTLGLNRALVLEGQTRTDDGAGGFTRAWTTLGTLWGSVRARTGRMTREGEAGSVSVSAFQVIVRGAPEGTPQRPKPGQRFRMGTRIFTILAVTEDEPAIKYLLCECREEIAT